MQKVFPSPKATLLRCPKIAAGASALILALFDRGHSSRSLLPPPAAVALVPALFKNLNQWFEVFERDFILCSG